MRVNCEEGSCSETGGRENSEVESVQPSCAALEGAETGPRARVWLEWLPGLFMPRRFAARIAHLPLRRLLPLHWISVLSLLVSIAFATSVFDSYRYRPSSELLRNILDALEDLLRFVTTDALGWLALLILLVGPEFGFCVLAVAIGAWGTRDEPWWCSFRNALKAVWILIPLTSLLVLAPALLCNSLRFEDSYRNTRYGFPGMQYPSPPRPPTSAPGSIDSVPAWAEYEQSMRDHQAKVAQFQLDSNRRWDEYRAATPWVVRHADETAVLVYFISGMLFIALLLGTVSAPRPTPAPQVAPTCESCGYNLATLSMEGRCPECGSGVAESLGPAVRPGSPWSRRAALGLRRAWFDCCLMPIHRPIQLGRLMLTRRPEPDRGRFLAIQAAFIGLVAFGSLMLAALTMTPVSWNREEGFMLVLIAVCFSIGCAAASILVSTASAQVVGFVLGRMSDRNLVPAAMQVATYLMGYMLLWAAGGAFWTMTTLALLLHRSFRDLNLEIGDFHPREEFLALIWWATPNVLAAAFYYSRLIRGTYAARFGNR